MKKLLLLLMLLMPLMADAQDKISVVTLKNGTQISGVIKAIDPMDAMTIVIGGIETTIKMADVAKVEEEKSSRSSDNPQDLNPQLNSRTKLIIRDEADYPEAFGLTVGDAVIKMVLVRGGDMNMGWEGQFSRFMDSEPIHPVQVSSFYMSETFVTSDIASQITGKKKKQVYYDTSWKKANEIVGEIAKICNLPLRLPTEAEWEYAACAPVKDVLFKVCAGTEFCSDWFAKFKQINTDDVEIEIDPTGPKKGSYHVLRAYNQEDGKFDRSFSPAARDNDQFFRLVIKAKDVVKR